MINREELALIWFNYNDINFAKVEKILRKFDKIEHVFDKNLVNRKDKRNLGGLLNVLLG